MEEDIDDLLEEVENKFINQRNNEKPKKLLTANIFSAHSSFRCDSSDYDDILRDVEENSDSKSICIKKDSASSITVRRCFPLYLGGSDFSNGYSTIGAPRACNNLHCFSCDFAVFSFNDFQWAPSTSYLFLRTNMPDFERIKESLVPMEGCRAYACQCSHYSTSIMQQVQSVPRLSWVCKTHPL
ncbi:cilia- and flagella-associated protein 418-like [Periplaneta americana]|uniref:cilia- and flagella-associated protein 418-like n=1 Tax=Periplaneta americana TaxID=6978 RepID=UPI0037E7B5B1